MKLIESIKTILFVGLFISALLMVAIYIIDAPGRSMDEFGNIPEDVVASLRGTSVDRDLGFSSDQLLPAFLDIRHGGGQEVGLLSGTEMMKDVVELLSPWFADVLGEEAVCELLPAEEGDALWQACMTKVNYFYLSWNFNIPASLLRAHRLPNDDLAMLEMAQGTLPLIKDIFFLPGASDDLFAVSRDSAGRVSTWRCDRSMQINLPGILTFSPYLEKNVFSEYCFAGLIDPGTDAQLMTLPVFDEIPLMDVVAVNTPLGGVNNSTRLKEEVLGLFSYNLSKLGSYYEADTDTVIYIETHGTLRASADAIRYEATASGGISVTDFVRESDPAALTLRDDLIACETLVAQMRRISPRCMGGNATPMLTSIRAEDDTLILEYAYFYDNIRLASALPAIQLTVRGHKLISVSISALEYSSTDEQTAANGQRWMQNLAHELDGDLEIRLTYVESGADRLTASWQIFQLR
ncbi:MAG: hypothetical protein IKL84_01480 [Clostridia bacterium]|nr:hypothetical protein [Clostridia bacterium]